MLKVQDTYGNSGNMNFMTSGNKKVAMAAVDRIQAGGGTNLSAGLFRAVDHHQLHTLLDSAETQDTGTLAIPLLLMTLLLPHLLLLCSYGT